MISKILAICVVMLLLGGAVQAADFHVAATATVELDDPAIDVVVPVEPVVTFAPLRHAIAIEMPGLPEPLTSGFAPRMDRPPRT
ncbi:MAG: hypothetical protein ABI678_29085 [Kofleriaceae bacterium]